MAEAAVEPIGWERALMAAEKVKERLRRATRASTRPACLMPSSVATPSPSGSPGSTRTPSAIRATSISWSDVPTFPPPEPLSKRPASFIITSSTSIRSSTGRKANRAAGSISSSPAKKFGGTTSTLCRKSTNRNEPSNFKWPTSKHLVRMKLIACRRQGPGSLLRSDRRRPSRRDLARPLPAAARRSLAAIAR